MNRLKQLLDKAMAKPEFRPDYPVLGVTHCNGAVQYVCEKMGLPEFRGKVANEIVRLVEGQPERFPVVDPVLGQKLALDGRAVLAGIEEEPHGHVALVYPTTTALQRSNKWGGIEVPWIANVGKKNGVMGANWAFGRPPRYWRLT